MKEMPAGEKRIQPLPSNSFDNKLKSNRFGNTLVHIKKKKQKESNTLPVPGGPASSTALPAIFLLLISSTITPHAYKFDKYLYY